jgi:tetratricopeptide (TPR) repeat protein
MVRPMNNLSARAWVSLVTGVYYAGLGQWPTAHGLFDEVIKISEKLGDRRHWDDGVTNMVMVNYFQGEFASALDLADSFYASASRRGDVNNQAWALKEQAYCALALGQRDVVEACVTKLHALFSEHAKRVASDEPLKIDVYGLFAITRLRAGQREAAWEVAEQALQWIAHSSPTSYPALLGYASVAEVCLALWQGEAQSPLKVAAQQACKGLHKFAGVFPIGRPRAWLWQGHYEWRAGRHAQARQAWHKSLEAGRKLMMPYSVGLAHAELGRHASANDPEREVHLQYARQILAQLGAATDLAHVQGH